MASHMSVNESKSRGRGKRLAWIIPLVVLGVALLAYLGGVAFFNFYFMPGTTLDGQDVSLRSAREVAEEKSAALASYQTHVSGAGVDLTLSAADINLSYDGDAYAREAVDQTEPWAWPVQLASGTRDVSVESGVLFDQQALLACPAQRGQNLLFAFHGSPPFTAQFFPNLLYYPPLSFTIVVFRFQEGKLWQSRMRYCRRSNGRGANG